MKLVRLTKNSYKNIKNIDVYLYEKSYSYLSELCNEYDILDNISGIFDQYSRNQGGFEFKGHIISVMPVTDMMDVCWKSSVLIITSDYFHEAFFKVKEILKGDNVPEIIYYFVNKESRIDLSYREKFKDTPLQDIILFRSGPHASGYVKGLDFADNARALFEYMLKNGYNHKYELVWLVKNPEQFTEPDGKYYRYARDYKNVHFIGFDWSETDNLKRRDEYYRVLCLAKCIFMTDAYGFCRNARADQIRVQLWHGCGFKTRTNFVSCEKRYEYNIVISELYKKIHKEIYGLRDNQVVIMGAPKADWIFNKADRNKLSELGIPEASRYIFWLPTFRKAVTDLSVLNEQGFESEIGLPIISNYEDFKVIDEILAAHDAVMVIKLHPFQNVDDIHCEDLEHVILIDNTRLVDVDIQINEILGYADALISDYSSVAVEYLLLDRPIAFTLDDVKEYENSRGFVFDNIREYLPGAEVYEIKDLIYFIEQSLLGVDYSRDRRTAIRNKMHKYFDGNSCERVARWMLDLISCK